MKPSSCLSIDRYELARSTCQSLVDGFTDQPYVLYDVGAGDARFAALASHRLCYFGFDREAWGDIAAWDLNHPCPNQELMADIVFFLDVIEHLANPGIALRNIANATKPGGVLILTTPNPQWSGSRFNLLLKGFLSSFSPNDLLENYHILPIYPHVLEKLLAEVGFEISSYVSLDGRTRLFDSPGTLKGPARWLLNIAQIAVESLDPSAKGMCYGVVARKSYLSPPGQAYP